MASAAQLDSDGSAALGGKLLKWADGVAVAVGDPLGVLVGEVPGLGDGVAAVFSMSSASDALPSVTLPGFSLWLVTSMV